MYTSVVETTYCATGLSGSPPGKCLASNRAAFRCSPAVPAEESIERSLTYLPCEEATEAEVAGMEAIVKQRKGEDAKERSEGRNQ